MKSPHVTQNLPSANTVIAKYSFPILVVLVAAGLAGNYFKYQIFLNIDFLFGSIFAMLALQFLGLARGVAASALIAGYTYVLWFHPYAIIIMTAEVAIVGILMRRRKVGLVLADTLYWLIIGMPLVYFFYHFVMNVPLTNTSMVMVKQAVNGITNALIARLVFTGFAWWSRSAQISFSELISSLLAFFVLLPSLGIMALSSRTDFNEEDNTIRSTLAQQSANITQFTDIWVQNRNSAISNLAVLAATRSPQEMQSYLEQTVKSDINISQVGLMDKVAYSIAYFPSRDTTGKNTVGIDFAERLYIAELKTNLKPMLSEGLTAKIGSSEPIFLMLAPVIIEGNYGGYVAGTLDLHQIREHLERSTEINNMFYTLLDKNNRVIITNRPEQNVMQPFVRDLGVIHHLSDGVSQWIPAKLSANTPIMERWKKSVYLTESAIGNLAEWSLVLEQPVAPFQKILYNKYTRKLTVLALILLVSLLLAELLSRRINTTFEKLGQLTHHLSDKVTTESKEIEWPKSSIYEADHLIINFKEMAHSLAEQFIRIEDSRESLEKLVSELRESEERFSGMFRKHSAVMLLIEPETRAIIDANSAAEKFYGYSRESLLAMKIEDINISKKGDIKVDMNSALIEKENFFIFKHKKANGDIRTVEVNSTAIPMNGTKKLFSIINDITEQIQAEEERNKLQSQLQQAQKLEAIGTLAGGIAHDFNNILGAVIGYAEMIKDDAQEGSNTAKDIDQVLKASLRAKELVKQILAFSRQAEMERVPLEPLLIVKEITKLLRSTLPTTIEITLDCAKDSGLVLADPTQLHQVVLNLCTNAYQAMEEIGGTIAISLKNKDLSAEDLAGEQNIQPGRFVQLSVADNGTGIEPEILDNIFNPYFTTKETGKGSGMGLAIIHGIVKSYGGFITCRSTLGDGSAFHVFLPAVTGAIESEIAQEEQTQEGTERILFVDDEEMLANIGKQMLERLGYKVTIRTNSMEALATFQNQPDEFDMVITDQTMPNITGNDLARLILQIRPDVPIILCTGYSSLITAEQAASHGIKGFVFKPLTKKEVSTLIRNIFDEKLVE